MKKNRYYLWILLIVIIAASAYGLMHNRWSTSQDKFKDLLLTDENKLESLLITDGSDTVFISKKGEHWYADEEELNSTAVNNLVYAAGNLSLKGMMQFSEVENIHYKADLTIYGPKRELCEIEFLATGRGYFVRSNGSDDVYEVELVGHEDLLLEKVFSTELNHYRKHVVIDLLPGEISYLKIEPISGSSFCVRTDTAYRFAVSGFDGNTEVDAVVNMKDVQMLLTYFSALRYERILDVKKVFPGGLPEKALSIIEITTKTGSDHRLEVYPLYDTEKQEVDIYFAAVRYNGREEMLKMNYYYLDLLMRGLEHYSVNN